MERFQKGLNFMTETNIKAVAVDMDGTFMDSNKEYNHEDFERVLTLLKSKGIHFIVASGRPLLRLKEDFKDFLDRIDMVADNGAVLVRDNKIVETHCFTRVTLMTLIKHIQTVYPSFDIAVSAINGSYFLKTASSEFKEQMNYYYLNKIELNSFSEMPDDIQATKITLWSDENPTTLEKDFNNDSTEKIHVTASGFKFTDILPANVNKANGIKYFLKLFNLKPSQLMAFGDSMNDFEMLELAGHSYAMGNADPAIKEIAKFIAPSNDENGVLNTLEKYFN